jgi:hypothetical protein
MVLTFGRHFRPLPYLTTFAPHIASVPLSPAISVRSHCTGLGWSGGLQP